jgi:hypothetical protein
MRNLIIAVLLATSALQPAFAVAPAPVEEVSPALLAPSDKELKELQKIFDKIFPASKEPINPERLALAKQTADKIMPEGVYGKMMTDLINKVLGSFIGGKEGMSDFEIATQTGVEIGEAGLAADKRLAVTRLLDSRHADRMTMITDTMVPMVDKIVTRFEPPFRDGLSRAYARKFTSEQLAELNRFFSTPVGSLYAAESLPLQIDPEVMRAVIEGLPDLVKSFTGPELEAEMKAADAKMKALPKPRNISDLNEAELDKLAGLLGTTTDMLKEHSSMAYTADTPPAAFASDDPFANETGEEPWWDRGNWSEAERRKIVDLEIKSYNAAEQADTAALAYTDYETEVMKRLRDRYIKQGWTPPAKTE